MIERARLVEDLRAMIRIPSITGSEEAIADWVADELGALGLVVETIEPALADIRRDPAWPGEEMPRSTLPVVIGRIGQTGGRRVVLSGHLDVVPPGDPAAWTTTRGRARSATERCTAEAVAT